MSQKDHFYVTTPIYYATAKPHLGSLYSTVLADIFTRIAQLAHKHTFFLTGTDEHGQKIATAAAHAGKDPQSFVDSFIPAYKAAWNLYRIEYDRFIRTTDEDHKANVQKFIRRLIAQGDVYKGAYKGWYCVPCETFLTEKESQLKEKETTDIPLCPSCNRTTLWMEEHTYFFKLSAYQEKLLAWYRTHPEFIVPKERAQEVIRFIEAGLKDLSISRTEVKWGVPFPDDPEHTLYVWVEALCNYITGIEYGKKGKEATFHSWWPADIQIMAKDIIRFHGIFWPALLMAAGIQPPKRLLVHGWIKVNDQKMSKSLGNAVDPVALADTYNPECIRYFMARHLPITQDGEFSISLLEQAIESELANDLGNLLNRMILLAEKQHIVTLTHTLPWSTASYTLYNAARAMIQEVTMHLKDCQLHLAYARVWQFVKATNGYFHEQAPWKVAVTNKELFNEILCATAHALRTIAIICWPVMPSLMEKLLHSLGHTFAVDQNYFTTLQSEQWNKTFTLTHQGTLFVKPAKPELESQVHSGASVSVLQTDTISIDTFKQCQLRAGTIIACRDVPEADKLLCLTVSFGSYGTRQILSGIKKWYTPNDLMGKQYIFLYNLQARTMVKLTSEGMILCVPDAQGKPTPVTPITYVSDGTLLG